MKFIASISLITILTLLTGCASNVSEMKYREVASQQTQKISERETLEIDGKIYYVESTDEYYKRGTASWYGHAFHGRRTASGEPFDMYEMTAAHPSISLPAYMRVTDINNGKSVIVRVNDRMPRHKTRIIDLSYAAAKELDIHRAGLASVEIARVYLEPVDK